MTDEAARPGRPEPDLAAAAPTKSFFVDMLVRDIELRDPILDLLDNCVDGILRSKPRVIDLDQPYKGRRADIVVGADHFSITDNCGGIPIEIARKSAFAIGRPQPIPGHAGGGTVGMYGVGMKRAIFKFGKRAVVTSHNDDPLRVEVTPKWLRSADWDALPIEHPPADAIPRGTTTIVVTELNPPVAAEFAADEFREELATAIGQHFALIIAKGFAITIREREADPKPDPIAGEPFSLLGPTEGDLAGRIVPHVYKGTIGRVHVELYAGLYRSLLGEEESEEEEWSRGSADQSGWSVACNDRIVIWKDRTRLTGWGEATVPNWHGQFLSITGILILRADDPDDLPLTTTKRGVDGASEIYSIAKDMMRESTKAFTNLTNKWKASSEERRQLFNDVQSIDLCDLRFRDFPMRPWHKKDTVQRFAPALPAPKIVRTEARVSFAAPKDQVVELAIHYFDDAAVKPRYVGEEAFRREYIAHIPQAAE